MRRGSSDLLEVPREGDELPGVQGGISRRSWEEAERSGEASREVGCHVQGEGKSSPISVKVKLNESERSGEASIEARFSVQGERES